MSDSSSDNPILLVGLKGTGKTHFLVALDWILDRQTDPDGLRHSDLADDRSYLQPLREMWLRGEEFERTSRTNPPSPHHLRVMHSPSGINVNFHLPDLAGETFDSYFVTRSFPIALCERLKAASGICLFVHCDSNSDHAILDDPAIVDKVNGIAAEETTRTPATDWKLEDAARQTKLVELLQFVAVVRRKQPTMRIAVVLSAWDLVEKAHPSLRTALPGKPDAFLDKLWPLLSQYLKANADKVSSRVYGVSARGGGASPEEIKRLIEFDDPSLRVTVVDNDHRSSDLSRPIRWILNLPDSNGRTNR